MIFRKVDEFSVRYDGFEEVFGWYRSRDLEGYGSLKFGKEVTVGVRDLGG